jgi:hypothetical protein
LENLKEFIDKLRRNRIDPPLSEGPRTARQTPRQPMFEPFMVHFGKLQNFRKGNRKYLGLYRILKDFKGF